MNDKITKFLLLISSSDLTRQEIREICSWIELTGAASVEKTVESIRTTARQAAKTSSFAIEIDHLTPEDTPDPTERFSPQFAAQITERIESLLRTGTHLSVNRASQALFEALLKYRKFASPKFRPKEPKENLRRWIERTLELFPPHIVMFEAARIHNLESTSPIPDWRLRNDK